jgi:hypothetical protein
VSDPPDLRLLLCWGYHRAGWIQPFETLRETFDVQYLFHRTRDEEEGCLTDAPRLYWMDFHSADELIDVVIPDRIVFMALDGAWAIALNAAARRRGIPTFVVQHGHFDHLSDLQLSLSLGPVAALSRGNPIPALRFAAASFGFRRFGSLVRVLRLMQSARREGAAQAMSKHVFEERMPDVYVALSPESAKLHLVVDRVSEDRIACIGIPEYDRIYQQVSTTIPHDGSLLLLDSPNSENRWGSTTMSIDEKIGFLRSLDMLAERMGRPLRVKLHPETYGAGWLPPLRAGIYLRDADLIRELEVASVCVGFDSTLLIPAVWLRPTVMVALRPSVLASVANETGAALVVSHVDGVNDEVLTEALARHGAAEAKRAEFSRRLATTTTGTAVEALGRILTLGAIGATR